MTLRIQCPSCSRQFKVGEDLRGRTVECGACEKQFRVDDLSIVTEREKFFPDDQHKGGLERYGRAPAGQPADVRFATATYNESASASDVLPASPQRVVASALGVIVMVLFIVILVFGTQDNGLLQDMEIPKRTVLAGFVVAISAALILYGGFRRKARAFLTATALGAVVMVLAMTLQVPRTMQPNTAGSDAPSTLPPVVPDVPRKLTEAEVKDSIGYEPILKSIEAVGSDSVIALWAPTMKERFKYQLQKFLQRKAGLGERPGFYRRENGGLFILEGTKLGIPEVEALVNRFGAVDEVYPNIRIIKITVEGERLLEAGPELSRKLTDKEHPAFYALNQTELDHIDIDRVKDAAQRLGDVEPKRFRPEITKRLLELTGEGGDSEFLEVVVNAIKVWSQPGDGSELVIAKVADSLVRNADAVPRSMVEFLIERESPDALLIVKTLWLSDISSWEPVLEQMGAAAEKTVADRLGDPDRAVRQSAVRLLRRIGTRASLPALRKALENLGPEDEGMRSPVQTAIDAIEKGP